MTKTREQIFEERSRLRAEHGELFDAVSVLLFRHDPIGIAFENRNTDEYDPEVRTILPELRFCKSADDVAVVVHEQFANWFGEDTAGSRSRYLQVASEIWQLWQSHRPNTKS